MGRLGPGREDDASIRILNRIVEWTAQGISYEADQRHAELIVKDLGLGLESKSVTSPGVKEKEIDETPIDSGRARVYRGLSARGNYMTQDRSDCQFAVKELVRSMATPTETDWARLKRVGRYLCGRERVIVKFGYQEAPTKIVIWTDSDWAGCLRTRKSTSGGVAMLGHHMVKSWSSTQRDRALSSGEQSFTRWSKAPPRV